MEAALISTWTNPARGREQEALQVFMDFMAYWQKQAEAGKCQPQQVFIGLNSNGMSIVQGESDVLQGLTESDEFRELSTRVGVYVDGYEIGLWAAGEEINRLIETYGKTIASM